MNLRRSTSLGILTLLTRVRFKSTGVITEGNMAIAMGNYYFTPADGGDEVKVEYTFGYTKDDEGNLKIILHGSHIPYSPAHSKYNIQLLVVE